MDLPLWLPGQRAARRALAESLGLRADALERYLRWEVAGRVRETAWATALAQGRLRHAEHSLEDTRTLETQVARRVDAGELARVDLLLARQETLTREVALQSAQAELDAARQRFDLLTTLKELPAPLEEPVARRDGSRPRSSRSGGGGGDRGPGPRRARPGRDRAPRQPDPQPGGQADPGRPRRRTPIQPCPWS